MTPHGEAEYWGAAYGVKEGERLAGGLALAAAVAGDEEALHAGAQRVGPLPDRLAVGKELALPPTTLGATGGGGGRVWLALSTGGHHVVRGSVGGWRGGRRVLGPVGIAAALRGRGTGEVRPLRRRTRLVEF